MISETLLLISYFAFFKGIHAKVTNDSLCLQMGNGPPNRMMMFNPGQPNMIRGPRMANMPNVRMPQQQAVQQQVCSQNYNKVLTSVT